MRIFKKIALQLIVLASLLLGTAAPVLAGPNIGVGGTNDMTGDIATKAGYDPGTNQYSLSTSVGRIIKVVLSLVGTIFFVLTVYAGILWMTAAGNEEAITKATGIMKMAVIGLIITLAGYSITYFITNAVTNSTYSPQQQAQPVK